MHGLSLERGGGQSLWRQIGNTIEGEIERGDFAPGAQLPTEAEFAMRFGVNRHTVRRAMAELAGRGLLRVEQGRGMFVQENVIDYPVGRRTRFSENVTRSRGAPGATLLRALELPAPEPVATALELRAGTTVILLERVGQADGRPVNIGAHYFPSPRFAGLIEAYRQSGSITAALSQLGISDYTRKVTRVTARMPTGEEAKLLQQPANRPILQTEAVNLDSAGRPIEYGIGRFASDRVQLVFEP